MERVRGSNPLSSTEEISGQIGLRAVATAKTLSTSTTGATAGTASIIGRVLATGGGRYARL
jgi:hypothetical protein